MYFYLPRTQARSQAYSLVDVVSPRNAIGHPQLACVLRLASEMLRIASNLQARMAETRSEWVEQALLRLIRVVSTRYDWLRRPC